MAQPYVGEIRMVGFSFAPAGWAFCNGALLPISENETLFNLIGTTYGGDGQETFQLPDLQGRVPVHNPGLMGQQAGTEQVTLTVQQIPIHNHAVLVSNVVGGAKSPQDNFLAKPSTIDLFSGDPPDKTLTPASAILPTGGSQPHDNMQPFLCINFVISLYGIFPSQT